MLYVDQDYYYNVFSGEEVDGADFSSLCQRAGEVVEEMSMYRVAPETFSSMPEAVQERVKKAVCAQIEYLDANGGSDMDTGASLQSAGLGKFSYTAAGDEAEQRIYAPRALRYLAATGLLYRGGDCY